MPIECSSMRSLSMRFCALSAYARGARVWLQMHHRLLTNIDGLSSISHVRVDLLTATEACRVASL